MAKIIKSYKKHFPRLKLVGKCYKENERINGNFSHKWCEWHQKGWFNELENIGKIEKMDNGYIGFMRNIPDFEYWIGVFLPVDIIVPEEYDYLELEECNVAICWIKGKEEDGIYNMHEKCLEEIFRKNMGDYRDNRTYFFERYNCPRFTNRDEEGNIILDYGIYLLEEKL